MFIVTVSTMIYNILFLKKDDTGKTIKKKKEHHHLKFTIKSVIRWEQIRGVPFSQIDYGNKEDIELLLYVMYLGEGNKGITLNAFRQVMTDDALMKSMTLDMVRTMDVISQFQKKEKGNSPEEDSKSGGTIGDIVASLIMSGLDANYALNEMELCDIPLYVDAYEKKKKEEMESARLWTYLTIIPHIDAKKMENGAKDLIMFPWETEESKKNEEITDSEVERFESFMKNGKNLIKR